MASPHLLNLYGVLNGLNWLPIFGANHNHNSAITLEVVLHTRFRKLFWCSDGNTAVIEESLEIGLPQILTYYIPASYIAQPALLKEFLFHQLSAINRQQLTHLLVYSCIQAGSYFNTVVAEVENFIDRYMTVAELSQWFPVQSVGLDIDWLDNEDEEEEEARRVVLSASAIDELKKNGGLDSVDGRELGTCSVCLDNLSGKLIRLPCSHLYHESCILCWLEKKNSCPICRTALLAH